MTGVHILRRTYAHVLTDEPAARLAELRGDVAALYGLDGAQGVHGDLSHVRGAACLIPARHPGVACRVPTGQ